MPLLMAVAAGAPSRRSRYLWLYLLLLAGVGLFAPMSASAHLKTGALATDFEARVTGFRHSGPGLAARVIGGDQRLELQVEGTRVVVVLGLLGEPFLRFTPGGVDANLASPTASSAGVVAAGDAVAKGVRWRRVTRAHVLAWHEGRLRPMPSVRRQSTRPRAVAVWSIPLRVDGKRAMLMGTEWYAAGPSMWPWLITAALLLLAAGVACRVLPAGMQRRLASALLPLAVAALIAGWTGILLADRATAPTVLFALVYAAATAFLILAAVAATRGATRFGVMALIGAFTAAFALPEVAVFGHGFVLSALPAVVTRLTVAIAVVGGIASAMACGHEVRELFGGPSRIQRAARRERAAIRRSRS